MHLKKQRTFMGYQQKVLPLQSLFRKHGNIASSEEREMGKSLTASSLGIPQDGNVARVRGCSGAIRIACPPSFLHLSYWKGQISTRHSFEHPQPIGAQATCVSPKQTQTTGGFDIDYQWLRRGTGGTPTCVYVYSPIVESIQNIQQPSPNFNTYSRRTLRGDANMRFSHSLHNHLSLNRLQHPRVIKHATFHIQHEITRISLCKRYAFALRYMVFRHAIHGLWCLDTWSFATR